MRRGKGFFPGSLGGGLEARSSAEVASADGDAELVRGLGGGRGGPEERSARAAASAFAAIAPSVAARSAAFAGRCEPRPAATVSLATARREDGGGGIGPRSTGKLGRAGRGGVEAWTADAVVPAPSAAGSSPPTLGCAEVGEARRKAGDADPDDGRAEGAAAGSDAVAGGDATRSGVRAAAVPALDDPR